MTTLEELISLRDSVAEQLKQLYKLQTNTMRMHNRLNRLINSEKRKGAKNGKRNDLP